MEIIILVAFFLSLSLLSETLGVWGRVQGAYEDEPTTGYSTHVRVATLGRFFVLLSAPALGYLVDLGSTKSDIALIGLYTFLFSFLGTLLFIKYGAKYFKKLYELLNGKECVNSCENMTLTNAPLNKKFYILACISFLLTATGVILVNYFAVVFYDLRAMIVQLSAVITMFGTLVHVFLIDPLLSRAADENKETLLHYSVTYLHSRLMVSAMLSVTFYILYMFS